MEHGAPTHSFSGLSTLEREMRLTRRVRPIKPALDAETERAARAFMQRLEGRYPVREGILFGSRARHTHGADSDADIAVVLKGQHGSRTAARCLCCQSGMDGRSKADCVSRRR